MTTIQRDNPRQNRLAVLRVPSHDLRTPNHKLSTRDALSLVLDYYLKNHPTTQSEKT